MERPVICVIDVYHDGAVSMLEALGHDRELIAHIARKEAATGPRRYYYVIIYPEGRLNVALDKSKVETPEGAGEMAVLICRALFPGQPAELRVIGDDELLECVRAAGLRVNEGRA